MIFPTEKTVWGIPLAGLKLKGKSVLTEEPVKDQTGAFVDVVNALFLTDNFKDLFAGMIGKVNIPGENPVIYQSKDLIGIEKKDDLQMDCQDEKHAAVQAKGSQKYYSEQGNAQQSIHYGFKFKGVEKLEEIQNSAPDENQEETQPAEVKKTSLPETAIADSFSKGLPELEPDNSQAGIQPKSEMDKPQVKAENPVILKNVRYETSAGIPKETGATQSPAGDGEAVNQTTVKPSESLTVSSNIGYDPKGLPELEPDNSQAGIQPKSEMDKPQVKAENPVILKNVRYETSAGIPKETGATQSPAGDGEAVNQTTVKPSESLTVSSIGYDPKGLPELEPDNSQAGIQPKSEMDKPQVKAENPVILKNVRYETSAGIPKETGATQSPAGDGEAVNQTTVKPSESLTVSSIGYDPKGLPELEPDNSQAGIQPKSEMDKPQSIVGDFTSLEVASFGLGRKEIAKYKAVQSSAGLIAQDSGHEISTGQTPGKGLVVQWPATLKNTGRISAANVKVPNGDEQIHGLQKQSDLLQNLAGSLSEATGVPRNTVSKQESVGTYRQVSISELPSVVLSALRSSGSREKLVRINLVPENLGPLTIKVKEIKDKLVIHFIASSANAKDILEVSMPQLKQSISQLSGSMDETLVFLSQEQGQGQGQNNHAQGGWNYYNNSLTRLLNDPVDDVQQTFENGINSQGVTRAVNYWV